jgi:hypothetical protein
MNTFDITAEQPISLQEATELIPAWGKETRRVSTATIRRWILQGYRGEFLDGGYIGRNLITSRDAIQRFMKAISSGGHEHAKVIPPIKSVSHERAMAELNAAGYVGK